MYVLGGLWGEGCGDKKWKGAIMKGEGDGTHLAGRGRGLNMTLSVVL